MHRKDDFFDEREIAGLIDDLGADEKTAIYAAQSLIEYGEEAVPYLVQALNDGDVDVRRRAIWPVWMIGSARTVDALIAALEHDPDAKVRRYAACALGVLNAQSAVHALIAAFADPDTRVCWDSAVAVAKLGTPALEPLVMALQYAGEQVRLGAVMALGWMREPLVVDWLTDALNDQDAVVRTRAAFALGWVGDGRAVEPLIEALQDEYPLVQMQAVAALGWLRDPRAVEPLIALLGADCDYTWLPYAVGEALSSIGSVDQAAVNALSLAARCSPNSAVRQAAQLSLEHLGLHPGDVFSDISRHSLWSETRRRCTLVLAPNA